MAGKGSKGRPMAIARQEFHDRYDSIDWSQPIDDEPVAQSPCMKVCKLDEAQGVCTECDRTVEEITNWSTMSREERADVRARLKASRGDRN